MLPVLCCPMLSYAVPWRRSIANSTPRDITLTLGIVSQVWQHSITSNVQRNAHWPGQDLCSRSKPGILCICLPKVVLKTPLLSSLSVYLQATIDDRTTRTR
ncbi:hypothetical protein C8R42DRAFT_656412 [Lentinula raphanica]|nr:hypothetical protein C8R42DRAFT_656412 [Lentinula raphanica]